MGDDVTFDSNVFTAKFHVCVTFDLMCPEVPSVSLRIIKFWARIDERSGSSYEGAAHISLCIKIAGRISATEELAQQF